MDIGNLDIQDRRNLYREDATNVRVVEADVADFDDLDLPEELETAFYDATAKVRSQRTKIAYVVIKISG